MKGYIHLPGAGLYRFGIASDASCTLILGDGADDPLGFRILSTSGNDTPANEADAWIEKPGLYSFTLTYRRTNEADTPSLEWYARDPQGNPVLINDASDPRSLRTFSALTQEHLLFVSISPTPDSLSIPETGTLRAIVEDRDYGIDPARIQLFLDERPIEVRVTQSGAITEIESATVDFGTPGSAHRARLAYFDTRNQSLQHQLEWRFTRASSGLPYIAIERAAGPLAVHFEGQLEFAEDVRGPYLELDAVANPYLLFPKDRSTFLRARMR
jgi:hypothetical protein